MVDKKDVARKIKDDIESALVILAVLRLKMKKGKGTKVQITLPTNVVEKIEVELKKTYLPKSDWFLKVVEEYFSAKKEKRNGKELRKRINLDI